MIRLTELTGMSMSELHAAHAELSAHISECCAARDGTCPLLALYGEVGYLVDRHDARERERMRGVG